MEIEQNSPFFSVIVPIYNVEKYLDTAVNSVLQQSFENFELILVDDGSSDSCPSICDKYSRKDARVKVIHKKNAGLVEARKSGANIARGIYSICLDGDDWLDLSALKMVYDMVKENSEPDMICFRLIETDGVSEKKNIVYNVPGFYCRKDIETIIFPMLIQKEDATYFAPSLCGKAIKTELYRKCQEQVSKKVVIGEDGACTIPCVYNSNSIYIMEAYLYYYRSNMNSITKSKKALSMDLPKYYTESLQKSINFNEYDFEEQLYRKVAHDLFFVIISQFSRKESFWNIRADIRSKLKEPFFRKAIEKAKFNHSKKAWIMMLALKYRIIILFKLYYMMK